jgi:hypothetical protein
MPYEYNLKLQDHLVYRSNPDKIEMLIRIIVNVCVYPVNIRYIYNV